MTAVPPLIALLLLLGEASGKSPDAFAVVAELDRVSRASAWPGFDARRVPVAIWDGEKTLLFRHPNPPEEFSPFPGRPGVFSHAGRHPSLRANAAVTLQGVVTATLLFENKDGRGTREWAATLLHETFHVFQGERHPEWTADEGALFLYPFEDPGPLFLRRLETEALRRAVLENSLSKSACWARAAIEVRGRRFALLPPDSAAYERGTELKEGLAEYVERKGGGKSPPLSGEDFGPEEIRRSAYATGSALAELLDRFDRNWKERLSGGESASLDEALSRSVERRRRERCGFSQAEEERARARAKRDTTSLETARAGKRRDFFSRPGWTLTISGGPEPLWPKGFDPSNLQRLSGGEVLHTRWLKLSNASASLEILDRASLTQPAGSHPLFNGVRTVTIAGLASPPVISEKDGTILFHAEGVAGEVLGGEVKRSERTVTILLP